MLIAGPSSQPSSSVHEILHHLPSQNLLHLICKCTIIETSSHVNLLCGRVVVVVVVVVVVTVFVQCHLLHSAIVNSI